MGKIVEKSKEVIVVQEEKKAVEVPRLNKPAEITSLISGEIRLYQAESTCW